MDDYLYQNDSIKVSIKNDRTLSAMAIDAPANELWQRQNKLV